MSKQLVQYSENCWTLREQADMPELQSRLDSVLADVKAADLDLSRCECGKVVVCIPDGLPMCEKCAEKESAEQ